MDTTTTSRRRGPRWPARRQPALVGTTGSDETTFGTGSTAGQAGRGEPGPADRLAPGASTRLRWFQPTRLRVFAGRLWLTLGDGSADRFLGPGAEAEIPAGARAVIECDSPQPAAYAWLPSNAPAHGPGASWRRRATRWVGRRLSRLLARYRRHRTWVALRELDDDRHEDIGTPAPLAAASRDRRRRRALRALQDRLATPR